MIIRNIFIVLLLASSVSARAQEYEFFSQKKIDKDTCGVSIIVDKKVIMSTKERGGAGTISFESKYASSSPNGEYTVKYNGGDYSATGVSDRGVTTIYIPRKIYSKLLMYHFFISEINIEKSLSVSIGRELSKTCGW